MTRSPAPRRGASEGRTQEGGRRQAGGQDPRGAVPRSQQPELRTPRLLLRPFCPEDAPAVRHLAGAREVALNTLNVPHPYGEGAAESWIAGHREAWARGTEAVFAITRAGDGELVGAMGLRLQPEHAAAELGYWIGVPFWGNGYATEAARAVLAYGFGPLGLQRIYAHHFARNPASGRVLEKIGMREEGVLRQHVVKWGERQDLRCFGILRSEHAVAGRGAEGVG